MSWWRGLVPVRFAPDGEARSRAGVRVEGGPPVQSDTGQNYYIVWGAVLSHLSSAASRTVPSRWACGRGGGGGCWDRAWQGCPQRGSRRWALRWRESLVELRQEAAGGGRQWLGGGGCGRLGGGGAGFVILQGQVLQSCVDPGWCLRLSSSTEWTVYEMACFLCFPLLCTETGTHSAFLLTEFGVFQYTDKVVDVLETRLLYGGLWKNFTYFLRVARAVRRAPFSGSHLPLCLASVYVAFGRISLIFIVLVVPASLRSLHLKIWTLFLLAVIWRWDAVFRRLWRIFRAPPGCPGVERQFLEPSMARSSLPSRASLANWTVVTWTYTHSSRFQNNNNNNTIWRGSVFTGEEPPPHSGELKHALTQAGGQPKSQLSRPVSSRHHISMQHRQRRKQLNSDTNDSNRKYLKEVQEKKKRRNFFFEKMKKWNEKH